MDPVNEAALSENLARVRANIRDAARRAGRDPDSVTIMAVTKTVPAERIAIALTAGISVVGENRAQELLAKAPELSGHSPAPDWHFIGRLQRNKVNALARWVTRWESVDRAELGSAIARAAPGAAVLVQVNVGREPQKGGCDPDAVGPLVAALEADGLSVQGLMAVPPQGLDPRPFFEDLVRRAEDLGLQERSIGMSGDYEVAVEAGATTVRLGAAIFGARAPETR